MSTNTLTAEQARPLRAYMVWCGDDPVESGAALVFAPTAGKARRIAWNCVEGEYIDSRAKRMPELDHLLDPAATESYYVTDEAVLREAGWHSEGDSMCAACELYTMDGRFPLCPDCDYCAECGHEEDCPNGK